MRFLRRGRTIVGVGLTLIGAFLLGGVALNRAEAAAGWSGLAAVGAMGGEDDERPVEPASAKVTKIQAKVPAAPRTKLDWKRRAGRLPGR